MLLAKKKEVDPDIPDEGRTPLSLVAETRQEEVVKLLLKREDVSPARETMTAEHHSHRLLRVGTRGPWDYYLDGKREPRRDRPPRRNTPLASYWEL